MNIIVTGASGFVGRALVLYLQKIGHDVMALNRIDFDRNDASLAAVCNKAEALVHLAGRAHKGSKAGEDSLFHTDNVLLTRQMLQLAKTLQLKHFIFLSSIGVLGQETHGRPLNESAHCHPQTPYARSKLHAEAEVIEFCSENGIAWTILRPPLVYGPNAPGNIGLLQKLIRRGIPLPFGAVRNKRTLIGIDNLVDVIAFCLRSTNSYNQVYNLGDGIDRSTPELLQLLAEQENLPVRLVSLPVPLLKLGAFVTGQSKRFAPLWGDLQVNSSKLQTQLNWQPKK